MISLTKTTRRVLFDARPGETCVTGIGRYARSMADALRARALVLDERVASRPESPLAEELELPAFLEREEVDLFHSPLFRLPAVLPCPAIVTVHDAIPLVHPELATPEFTTFFREHAADGAERAAAVICPTEHARQDLVSSLKVAPEKVHVVREWPSPRFVPTEPAERLEVLARHGLAERSFVLVVGALEPRKNPGIVLDALASLPEGTRPLAAFVGPSGTFDLVREAKARGLERSVRNLGVVADSDLVGLYGAARALVFPSLYEGFGLPIVEAFACGTPVLAADAGAIPEVAGDGAILLDPRDASAWARAIDEVADRREDLVERGARRLAQFTPNRALEELERIYDRVLEDHS